MKHKLYINLDTDLPRDRSIVEFLNNFPPRKASKKEFILDAIYLSITQEIYNEMRLLAKETKNSIESVNISKIKDEDGFEKISNQIEDLKQMLTHITIKASKREIVREETIEIPFFSQDKKPDIKELKTVGAIMSSLKDDAFSQEGI